MMFSHQDISEPNNRWESVAMSSYKSFPARDNKTVENEVSQEKAKNENENENEWVLVSMKETIEDKLPEKEQNKSGKGKRKQKQIARIHALPLTRGMTDTKYNRVFKRPLPHNYGHANTKPVTEENYLKTFNVKCKTTNEVYKSALDRVKDTSSDTKLKEDDKKESYVVPQIETEVIKVNEDKDDLLLQVEPKTDLTMSERLTWPDSIDNESEQNSKDPKSYSVLPPSLLNQIAPAGIAVKRSEPVSNLLCIE
mmetsp:Transcript_10958/g.13725  ORF Transcript_10958/g.13725 Transcript_10958/m.13725 type:complete len:253 (-) Transcript_10958:65-823(-)